MKVLGLAGVLVFGTAVAAQQFQSARVEAHRQGSPSLFQLAATASQPSCTVQSVGAMTCRAKNVRIWRFHLPTDGGTIEQVWSMHENQDLLVIYELTRGGRNWAKFVRVRHGAQRPAWVLHIAGLNLAPPVVRNDSVFVAALPHVARINVRGGFREWEITEPDPTGGELRELKVEGSTVVVTSITAGTGARRVACYAAGTGRVAACQPVRTTN